MNYEDFKEGEQYADVFKVLWDKERKDFAVIIKNELTDFVPKRKGVEAGEWLKKRWESIEARANALNLHNHLFEIVLDKDGDVILALDRMAIKEFKKDCKLYEFDATMGMRSAVRLFYDYWDGICPLYEDGCFFKARTFKDDAVVKVGYYTDFLGKLKVNVFYDWEKCKKIKTPRFTNYLCDQFSENVIYHKPEKENDSAHVHAREIKIEPVPKKPSFWKRMFCGGAA